jgi:hypothetical protein
MNLKSKNSLIYRTGGSNNNSNNNQIIPPFNPNTSTSLSNNITVPSFLTNKSLSNPVSFPNIHSSLNNNQLTPFILNRPAADNINTQSLSNQNLTFNSQPLTRAPQATKNPSHKGTRASLLKGVTTRPDPQPIADPTLTQTRPEKKPKIPTPHRNPTQNKPDPSLIQVSPEDMAANCEKKRRREEEEVNDNTEQLKDSEHFLTAGPGSQACRDQ